MTLDSDKLDPGNGITYGYDGGNAIIVQAMTAFTAIAWANCIEVTILIFVVFKKYEGVYFWSLLISTLSVIPYAIGAWTKQVSLPYAMPKLLPVALLNISWLILIPGQSIVLWSRLHLITQNQQLLRFVLRLIIVNWFLFCIPTTVFTWGSNTHMGVFVHGYAVYEKIQMVAFSAQEIFISGIYVWEVRNILRLVYEKNARKIVWELLAINIFIIALDIALLAVEFLNMYQVETTFKGMVYSIKLKLEFGVLSKLVKVALERKDANNRISSKDHNGGRSSAVGLDTFNRRDACSDLLSTLPNNTTNDGILSSTSDLRGSLHSPSARKLSVVSPRNNSASSQQIRNLSRDFGLSPAWGQTISIDETWPHACGSRISEEVNQKDRLAMMTRESILSETSDVTSYPGRLDPEQITRGRRINIL